MTSALLKCQSFVPPLLESQISPPYRIIARHLDYLQKWREYLLRVWIKDSDKNINRVYLQQSIDELISTILLIDFIGRSCSLAIPSLEEILKNVNKPTASSLCEVIHNQVSCKLLRAIFNPNCFREPMKRLSKDIELSSLTNLSEAAGLLYGSRMPITLFGDFYQLCLSFPVADKKLRRKSLARRNNGVYYTPSALVDYLVYHTLKKAFHKLEPQQVKGLRILDPSCGCGAFLVASVRFILEWLKDKHANEKKLQSFSPQENFRFLESMIYGTDIDKQAIQWTRRLLLLTIWDFYINNGISKKNIQNLKIPTFKKSIICRDFLEEQSLKNETFNVIIGGPPFVRIHELYKSNPARIINYKRSFKTAEGGQFDLYMLFIEKAIELLMNKGYLSMSVSNTFLRSESGHTLRELIAKRCAVKEIIEFEDSKLYPNALVQIATIAFQKTAEKNTTRHVFVKGKGGLRRKLSNIYKQENNVFLQTRILPAISCSSKNWNLSSENEINLLHKIESVGIPLGKLPIHIHFGAATGADKVFLLKNAEDLDSKSVLAESRFWNDVFVFESSILRPILRGRHIRGYSNAETETLCIFPYDKKNKLIAEDILEAKFPYTYKYLKSCRPYLGSRKLKNGQPWYAFRNENVLKFMQSPKIIGSVVSCGGGFTLDQDQHLLCNNSVILISPDENIINPYFLLAVLNSKIFWTWTQHRMPTLGLGWHNYRVGIFRKFPVPIFPNRQESWLFEEIANLATKLLNEKLNETNRAKILSLIDERVCKLYGISQDELPQYHSRG